MKAYQIYYKEDQKQGIDYIPYFNSKCTPFFENSVILDLRSEIDDDYFAVLSWKLREKLGQAKQWKGMKIANTSNKLFTPEIFEMYLDTYKPDAMSFQRHAPHDPISYADRFHPNFSTYFKKIMNAIGYNWRPTVYNDVFYCNYFTAKGEIYAEYIDKMLAPAMEVMENMPELFENSNYPHPLPEHLTSVFKVNYYPYHAFLCERMFSYFAHLNKLQCVHF